MRKVKVCGICDVQNVKEIIAAGADFLGFIFYPGSKRFVGKTPDTSLFRQVPSGILKAGVFVDEKADMILKTSGRYNLDMIQLHGNESSDYCRSLKATGLLIIKAFGINSSFDFNELNPYMNACEFFLFDTQTINYGGSGSKFDWSKIAEYRLDKPFFLSGGIGPDDAGIIKAFDHPRFFGVDINSRFETCSGHKDPHLVKAFINEIKN